MTLLLFGILVILTVVATLTVAKLLLSQRVSRPDPSWVQSFDPARYAPMVRLLGSGDSEFLRQAGVPAAAIRQLRTERRRIFRIYLSNLCRDFARLHAAARWLVLEADDSAPELAQRLATARLRFAFAVMTVRYRLVLHALGAEGVDVSRLIGSAAELTAGLRSAVPARQYVAH
ncbi:MAG TPA: hypothetical protein VES20_14005 [Bryobacteraceae bacterium]|nr:hypothetical protein [Bryobacteraceae bacterium]